MSRAVRAVKAVRTVRTVRLSDCQGLDSLDSGRAWSLSRSLDRALTLCQASVRPLSVDIAVKPVKTVRLSIDSLSNCQARAQPATGKCKAAFALFLSLVGVRIRHDTTTWDRPKGVDQ